MRRTSYSPRRFEALRTAHARAADFRDSLPPVAWGVIGVTGAAALFAVAVVLTNVASSVYGPAVDQWQREHSRVGQPSRPQQAPFSEVAPVRQRHSAPG